jgi:hypothetical protein
VHGFLLNSLAVWLYRIHKYRDRPPRGQAGGE